MITIASWLTVIGLVWLLTPLVLRRNARTGRFHPLIQRRLTTDELRTNAQERAAVQAAWLLRFWPIAGAMFVAGAVIFATNG